jgi:hypothetical protein
MVSRYGPENGRLIAFGDALHSPIQVDHPEWSCVYDHDRARSVEHRHQLVAELEEPTQSVLASTSPTWCSGRSAGMATAPSRRTCPTGRARRC